MGIFIRNAATERKIRTLARRTGESLTAAVEKAVDERLTRFRPTRKSGAGQLQGTGSTSRLFRHAAKDQRASDR
jgi:hypothetical protein